MKKTRILICGVALALMAVFISLADFKGIFRGLETKAAWMDEIFSEGGGEEISVMVGEKLSSEAKIFAVKLMDGETSLGEVTSTGNAFTITLPEDTDQEILDKVSKGGLYLKITGSEGSTIAQEGGYSGPASVWAAGTIMCQMELNTAKKFIVTAEDGETIAEYTITVGHEAAEPVKYKITLSYNSQQGTVVTAGDEDLSAEEGTLITLTAQPKEGYQLEKWSLNYGLNLEIEPEGGSLADTTITFKMPAANVSVGATFVKVEETSSSSDEASITSFMIGGVAGVIDQTAGTITVTVAYGTNVTALAPVIGTKNAAGVVPASGQAQNFTNPVVYTIKNGDGQSKQYIVTVYVQKASVAERQWNQLGDVGSDTSWWEFAEDHYHPGNYPHTWN